MENSKTYGKLIVIEGLDGSGKATQTALLTKKLMEKYNVKTVSFPNYKSDGSAPVRMYLGGEFGDDPSCVNAYAASSFYAVDRVTSYLKDWKQCYLDGDLFVLDRYTTSNMIYMTAKLDKSEWDGYLEWLWDFEYDKMKLPKPDGVIYLDMPTEVSQKLMSQRYKNDESKKDLHEKNVAYLKACREAALYSADKFGWRVISCCENEVVRSIDDIAGEVYKTAELILK